MPRSRPASNPISYHKHTKQYYVTRGGKRIYLGSDKDQAINRYHRLGLGIETVQEETRPPLVISVKELANRFLVAQQANWRNPEATLKCYKDWLGRFIKDHPRMKASEVTVEIFAMWKVSLKERGYSVESINHYLVAVRSMFTFAEETGIIRQSPKLKRIKNESRARAGSSQKQLYSLKQLKRLMKSADLQLKAMLTLALNCGFGPKDIRDLMWDHVEGDRVTLPRSKTGVCQTYLLWPETRALLDDIRRSRGELIARMAKQDVEHSDNGHIFVTRFWRPWGKDSVAEQFRKLCKKADVPCYGFYRLRHCASTAMSLVSAPHVHRKFMRHSQLQQQVAYTHIPDDEVDRAILKAKGRLFDEGSIISDEEKNREQGQVA